MTCTLVVIPILHSLSMFFSETNFLILAYKKVEMHLSLNLSNVTQ